MMLLEDLRRDKTLPLKDTFWTLLLESPRICQKQEVKAMTPILEFLLFSERQMLVSLRDIIRSTLL